MKIYNDKIVEYIKKPDFNKLLNRLKPGDCFESEDQDLVKNFALFLTRRGYDYRRRLFDKKYQIIFMPPRIKKLQTIFCLTLFLFLISTAHAMSGRDQFESLTEKNKTEIGLFVAGYFGPPLTLPRVVEDRGSLYKAYQKAGVIYARDLSAFPAHIYVHELVHVYQHHYGLTKDFGFCLSPKEAEAWYIAGQWCKSRECPIKINDWIEKGQCD